MKMTVKGKPSKAGHNLKHIRIEMSKNGGATVHRMMQGTKDSPFPQEENMGSHSSGEEALHHAGQLMGADVQLGDHDAGAAEEAAEVPPMKGEKPKDMKERVGR